MKSMKTLCATLAVLAFAALTVAAVAGAGAVTTETADVVGQGPGGAVVSDDGATLQRGDNGVTARVTMPTPQPGTYTYPPTGNAFLPAPVQGDPEAFSLWVFVFNYPALCNGPCDMDDIGPATPARGGVYNGGGHVEGGANLTLSGHVSVGDPQFSGSPLLEPRTAFIHLAVAPHGAVVPELMPDQIKKPIGGLPFWWIAGFE